MKSRKHMRINKRKGRKSKKGGFLNLFKSNQTVLPDECDPNKLTMIKGSTALHQNYQKCCPKRFLGLKNSSAYCKQLDLNFQSALKEENAANEFPGSSPEEAYNMKTVTNYSDTSAQLPKMEYDVNAAQTKPWYKFWGGKKTRKHRKRSYRHRK